MHICFTIYLMPIFPVLADDKLVKLTGKAKKAIKNAKKGN